jgi:tetratricopeptide (TPR) repeat protein
MSSKVPFVKQETVWLAIIPHILVIGILCMVYYQWDRKNYFVFGFFTYLIIWYGLRTMAFPKEVHKSIRLIKEEKFGEAIPYIERSIEFYNKHSWIDKYRFLLMVSSSKRGIRESSICNLGFCLLQIGQVKAAKEVYEDVLRQYPENTVAIIQLRTINTISNSTESKIPE